MKKKLLLIVEAMGGGVRRHVVDLINGLDKSQFTITLLYGKRRADASFLAQIQELEKEAQLIGSDNLVRELSPKQDYAALKEIKNVIREVQPDIVHCHSSKAGVLGRLAAKQMHIKKIFYTPHAYSFQAPEFSASKKAVFVAIERWMSRHATTMTFNVSKGERQCALENRLDKPEKFQVIYNGVPDIPLPSKDEARKCLNLPIDVPVVGTTVRLNEQKDPFTFIKIAKNVIQSCPNTQFLYIGSGPLFEPMQKYIQEHQLDKNVHLCGYCEDAELLVPAFDVFLLTSLYEGFPYALLEALRAGAPIVATDTVGNNEIVLPGQNGELFKIGDVEDGARAVLNMLNNPIEKGKITQFYRDHFSLEPMIDTIQDNYLVKEGHDLCSF